MPAAAPPLWESRPSSAGSSPGLLPLARVPAFFRWLSRKCPSIIVNCVEEKVRGLQAAATPTPRAPPCPGARAGRGPRGARRPPAGPAPAASPVAAGRVRALAVPGRERLGRCEGRPCAARGFRGGRLRPRLCLLPGRRPERLSLGERQSVAVVSGVARGEQRLGKGSDGTQWLPWPTCGVSGPEQGCLGEAVMRRLWEVTLGEEGARTLQEMLLRPPGFSLARGSGSPGAQRRDPKPPRKENHMSMICRSAQSQPPGSCPLSQPLLS
ncbi:hypothetical protein AB1E19_007438 [Capra hircus]